MAKVDQIKPRSILKLNDNLQIAFRMVENMKRIEGMLPGIDCSACGAPTCNALAEDVIRNESKIENCIFAHKKMDEFYKVMFDIWELHFRAQEDGRILQGDVRHLGRGFENVIKFKGLMI